MYFLHFSINNLTLLALTLAIGIVVDDAIIVLENAYRHQEELGEDPITAATNGTREIGFAVVATTIALVAVFTPLAFLKGNTGRLFNEFGIAVAGAVTISGFVALTLTPMLCARVLRVPHSHGVMFRLLENTFLAITLAYTRALGWALRHRALIVSSALATLLAAGLLFRSLKREFIPADDQGWFLVFIIAPEGSSLAYTDGYQRQVEAIIRKTPDIHNIFSVVNFGNGVSGGIVFVMLDDWSTRKRSVQQVLAEVQPQLFGIPGIFAFANAPSGFGGFGSPVQFVVQNPDFGRLAVAMDTLVTRARQVKGLQNVDTDLRFNKPQLSVSFDRDRAEDMGVSVGEIAATLQVLLGGNRVNTFTRDNKLYDVVVQLSPEERATPSDLSGLYVRGKNGQLVQLSALVHPSEGVGPRQLNHYDRIASFTLTAGLDPGFTLGEALDSLNRIAAEVLPPGSTTALAGESRELQESGGALYFAFALALLVVFMVLASQFESLIHPFTVLLAVPLAVTGALATLKVTGSTLNLYSQIGMILLIGLVTKNSILLVEYANQLKAKGRSALQAMQESGRIRLRPIVMTSVATITSAFPVALGLGAGSTSRRPLGYVIIGGVLFSTLLTLFLVPVVYVILDGLRRPGRAERRGVAAGTRSSAGWRSRDPDAPRRAPGGGRPSARSRHDAAGPDPCGGTGARHRSESRLRRRARPGRRGRVGAPQRHPGLRRAVGGPLDGLGPVLQARVQLRHRAASAERGPGNAELSLRGALGPQVHRVGPVAGRPGGHRGQRGQAALSRSAPHRIDILRSVGGRPELLQVADDRARRAEEQLAVARARVLSGATVQTDSLQLLLEFTKAQVEQLRTRTLLDVVRLELGRRTGSDGPVDAAPLETPVPEQLPLTLDQAVAEALATGPDWMIARASAHAAERRLQGLRGDYLPRLDLAYNRLQFDDHFYPSAYGLSDLNIRITWSLWDLGRRELSIAQATTQRNVADAVSADLMRAARHDVARAYEAFETARAALDLQLTSVVVAQETFRVQQERYKSGAATILDLLDAQVNLTQAQADLVQAAFVARLAWAGLEAILGRRLTPSN